MLLPFQPGSVQEEPGENYQMKKKKIQKISLGGFFLFPTKGDIQLLNHSTVKHSTVTASASAVLGDDNHSLIVVKPGQGYMCPR